MQGERQSDEEGDVRGAQEATRVDVRESFRHLERAPVGIAVVHGSAHTVAYANRSFRQSSGLSDRAVVGRPIADILGNPTADASHTSNMADLVALLDRVRGEQVAARDVNVSVNIGADTENQNVWRCTAWPVRGARAGIDQLVVELRHGREGESSIVRQRDIAERLLLSALREQTLSEENTRLYESANALRIVAESAQREAEAANSAKAQFLANMSHELRTPLNAIGGYAQLMEMGLRGAVTEAQLEDLARIQRSQAHLLGLINAVLNYAKLEAGHVVYATQDVALDDVVVEAKSLVSPQLDAKGLRYQYASCADLANASLGTPVLIRADAEKLRQILLNLLTNALKFTPSGGQITVVCRTVNGAALLSVSDTGRGIPADKLQTIFDPFVQIGRHLTSTDTGVGLGLAISRDLAVGMDGDLAVESIEGNGSTFTLTMPLAI